MLNNLLNRDLSAPAFLYVLFEKDAYARILLYSLQGDVEEGGPVPGFFQSNPSGSVPDYLMIPRQYLYYNLTLKYRMAKKNIVKTEYFDML